MSKVVGSITLTVGEVLLAIASLPDNAPVEPVLRRLIRRKLIEKIKKPK